MAKRVDEEILGPIHWVPHATLDVELSRFAESVDEGLDDLDYYQSAVFRLKSGALVLIRRYRGFPPGISCLYYPVWTKDVGDILSLVAQTLEEFQLDAEDVLWDRGHAPDL